MLCLERSIAEFPRFYLRCPLKMHPVRAYGRALENSRFKPRFRIWRNPVKGSNLDCAPVFSDDVALDIDFSTSQQ